MAPLAYFGIESSGFSLAVNLLILFLARPVLLADLLDLPGCSPADRRPGAGRAARPFVAVPLRRHDHLHDPAPARVPRGRARARARAARPPRRGCASSTAAQCPYCDYRIERDFVRCPSCLRKLKERCANCSRPLDQAWTICPYCEADVPGVSSPRVVAGVGPSTGSWRRRYERPWRPRERPSRRWPAVTRRPPPPSDAATAGGRTPAAHRPHRSRRQATPPGTRKAIQAPDLRHRPTRGAQMNVQRTLILVKPDAFARGLTGEIIARFERKGLQDRRAARADGRARAGRASLRRARRAAVLRRAGGLHHLRPARRDGARGPRGDRRSPPGDRRDQPAGGGAPAAFAATSPCRPARTWSTARTRRTRPRARRRCSSRSSPSPLAGPRPLVLASGSPQRRAILERVGIPFEVRVPERARSCGRARRWALTLANALAKARAVQRPRDARDACSGATRSSTLDGTRVRQARRRASRPS